MADNQVEVTIGAVLSKGFKSAFQSASKEVKGLERDLSKLGQQKAAIRQLNDMQKSTKAAGQAFTQAQTKLRMLQMQSERAGGANKQLTKNIEKTKREVESTKRELDQYNKKLKLAEQNTTRLGLSTNKLAGQYKKVSRELQTARKKQDALNRAQAKRDKMASAGGTLMGAGGGLLAAGAISAAIGARVLQPSLDLGANLSTVKAADQSVTDTQSAALRKQAISLGSTTQFTAVEASQGMLALTKAGLSAERVMKSLPGVLDFATAGSLELGQAAEVAANAMAQFKLGAHEASRVGDVFSLAANKSTIVVQDLVESMKFLGPAAAAVGTSIEEASAVVAVLGNQGFRGGIATRALSTAMLRLAKPTKEMRTAMSGLGISVFDSQGSFIGLTKTFEQLETKLKGASDEKKLNVLGAIFGGESAKQALGLLNAGTAELKSMTKALEGAQGSARKFAKIKLDNLKGDFVIFASAVEGLFTVLGSGATLILRPITQILTKIIQVVSNVIGSIFGLKEILGGLFIAFTLVTIAGGALLLLGGSLLLFFSNLPVVLGAVALGLGAINFALGALWALVAPFLPILIGITLAFWAIKKVIDLLAPSFNLFMKLLKESAGFQELGKALGDIWTAFRQFGEALGISIAPIQSLGDAIAVFLIKPIVFLVSILSKAMSMLASVLNNPVVKGITGFAAKFLGEKKQTQKFQGDVAGRTDNFDVSKVQTFGAGSGNSTNKSIVMDNRVIVNAEGVQDPQAVALLVAKQQGQLRNLFNLEGSIGASMQ